MSDALEVTFTHPRETDQNFAADVAHDCTAGEALQHLQAKSTGPFLETAPAGQPYQLVVHGNVQPPETTFDQMGVRTGDLLEVAQAAQGALR